MNNLLILFCYQRPHILKQCIQTLFANAGIDFDEVLLINDGSYPYISQAISEFVLGNQYHPKTKFSLMHFGKNQGYAYAAEFAFNYAKWRNPKYFFWIEQDYIWRKNWAIESLAVLDKFPETIGLSLYSNPDYYNKSKTEEMFPQIIKDEFGEDLCAPYRQYMHKPFEIETRVRKMMIQGTSNCCGTVVINWQNIIQLSKIYPEYWEKVIDRCCNKQEGGNRNNFSDGSFTHGNSFYWYKNQNQINPLKIDMDSNFPWLDICDYSLGNHINGGADSINGKIVAEGQTFVGSPKWDDRYLHEDVPKT